MVMAIHARRIEVAQVARANADDGVRTRDRRQLPDEAVDRARRGHQV
jgi:hypothetical protein